MLETVDRAQRRFPPLGVPIAVFYKFYDDQGHFHASTLTYYAFMAIFPLLLLASSILGFILQGNERLQDVVLNSALAQFPIIGEQLGRPGGLQGSTVAVIVGLSVALFGASGLGQAVQNTLNAAWAVPRNNRPNPFATRGKSLLLLLMAGTAIVGVTTATALITTTEVFGGQAEGLPRYAVQLATVVVVGLILTGLSGFAAANHEHVGHSWPGMFFIAVMWQVLQHFGTMFATTVLAGTTGMNQTFALVLGLMGMIYIAAIIGVLGIELNVVLARGLWPRALLTLFTDQVDLTEADRRAYAGLVHTQRLKGFQAVTVRFDEPSGNTHELVLEKIQDAARRAGRRTPPEPPPPAAVPPPPAPVPDDVPTVPTPPRLRAVGGEGPPPVEPPQVPQSPASPPPAQSSPATPKPPQSGSSGTNR